MVILTFKSKNSANSATNLESIRILKVYNCRNDREVSFLIVFSELFIVENRAPSCFGFRGFFEN